MKTLFATIVAIALTTPLAGAAAENREETQAALDAACETAREALLAPQRARYVQECVEKKQKEDLAACERFYRDYGERSGHNAAMYYHIEECVAAHDYRESYRQ